MSTGLKKKKSDVDVKIQDWIEKFNKAKGWQTLEVPSPESVSRRDKANEGFKKSPAELLQQRIDALGDPEGRREADEAVKKQRSELQKLEVHVVGVTDETQRQKIQDDIDRRKEELSELTANIELYDRLSERLNQVNELEESLPQDVTDIVDELKDLKKQVRKKKFDLDTLDKDLLARFRTFHEMVSNNIENARQEVMTMELTTDTGTVKNHYAIINSDEYRVLFGMLEMAVLTLQLGEPDDAIGLVQDASDRLVEYRNARTGAKKIESEATFDPKVDDQLRTASLMIDALNHAGRVKAATARKEAYDKLYHDLRSALSSQATDIADKFLGRATTLAVGSTKDVSLSNEIKELAIQAQRDAVAMRANGHKVRPGKVEEKLKTFDAGVDLTDGLKRMQEIRDYAAEKFKACKTEDVKKAKIDPKELQSTLTDLESRFDKFFKHDKDGTVRTQKDGKTGLDKGIKKNGDLPRETIEEIDLQLKAAQQLLAGDSIDALKLAEGRLGSIEMFLTNIEEFPDIYAKFDAVFKDLDKKIKKLGGTKYGMYEVSQRADLQLDLDKIRKSYLTKPQSEVGEKISELKQKIKDFDELVHRLRGRKHALEKQHDEVAKVLSGIGEQLKKNYNDSWTKFDGYHGTADGELSEVRAKIEFRTEESLQEADDLLLELRAKLDKVATALKTFHDDDGKLSRGDHLLARTFLQDAKRGQKKHDTNLEHKKTFETDVKALEKRLDKLKELVKKLKGDLSNHEALEAEVDTLKSDAKTNETYIDGIEQLKRFAARAEFMITEAENATEIVDAELGKAADMVINRVIDFTDRIKSFHADVVTPAGNAERIGDDGKTVKFNPLTDGTFDDAKIKTYFSSIVAAIPKKSLEDLKSSVPIVADSDQPRESRLLARKSALAAVRALTAVFDGFKPIQHFRLNPFDDKGAAPAFGAARQALPRLELRLLTAIKE